MITPLIVANWKANLKIADINQWLEIVKPAAENFVGEIVACPPHVLISAFAKQLENKDFKIKLGAQDVSRFSTGSYTGEVTAVMLSDLVEFCIVGHSERRRYFGEDGQQVIAKLKNLQTAGITPILCISDLSQLDSYLKAPDLPALAEKIIFVYEPTEAISTAGIYHAESPDDVFEKVKTMLAKIDKKVSVLYGGSVNEGNIAQFLSVENVAGCLIGHASINPQTFRGLLESVSG